MRGLISLFLVCFFIGCATPNRIDKLTTERNEKLIGKWYDRDDTLTIDKNGGWHRTNRNGKEKGLWETDHDRLIVNLPEKIYSGFYSIEGNNMTVNWVWYGNRDYFNISSYMKL